MKREIKSSGALIALVLAVAVTIPLAGTLALLFRAAALILITVALAGGAVAMAISPTFRDGFRSLVRPEPNFGEK